MHRLNMELDLQSLFGLLCTAVHIGRDTETPPSPTHLGSYTRALLVSQNKRHLFLKPPAVMSLNELFLAGNTLYTVLLKFQDFLEYPAPDPRRSIPGEEEFS